MNPTVLEILVDLVEEDLDRAQPLFEENPYRDAAGRFTSKDAATAYASGAMAAGRAAGITAKAAGKSREEVRAAIHQAMQSHQYGVESTARLQSAGKGTNYSMDLGPREHGKSKLYRARGEVVQQKKQALNAKISDLKTKIAAHKRTVNMFHSAMVRASRTGQGLGDAQREESVALRRLETARRTHDELVAKRKALGK
jgi:hypothetical protein